MDISKNLEAKIPKEVSQVTDTLERAGFEAYLVGGCVRDLLMGNEPKDWDVTTNARPEEIIALFQDTVYENNFGTVGVKVTCETPNESKASYGAGIISDVNRETMIIEVTPYRIETKYSDFRHPDDVKFSKNLQDDLKRRDFTVNAIAYRKGSVTDTYGGIKDIKDKVLKAVGGPEERFKEDALRM